MTDFQAHNIDMESGEQTDENATFTVGGQEVELHLPKLEDNGHPFIPEATEEYIAREIYGQMDIKFLSYVVNDPDYFAMLEGEAATGKNLSFKTLFSAANWPCVRVNFGMGTNYSNLVGRFAPVEDDGDMDDEDVYQRSEAVRKTAQRIFENNDKVEFEKALDLASRSVPSSSTSFEWVDGLLTKAVKYGWAFIADEINAAEEEAIMPLNGVVENQESRYLTIEEKSEIIRPHENFRFVATRNPASYAGVGEMNSALESRAYIIPYDYHEEMALKEIISNRSNILENESEGALEGLVNLANDVRRQEQAGNDIMTKISTRDLIKAARLTDIMDIRSATKIVFLGVADETDKQSIKEMIKSQRFQ